MTLSQEKDAEEVRKTAEKRRLEEDVEREIKRRREEQEAVRQRLVANDKDEQNPEAKLVYLAWKEADGEKVTNASVRAFFADFGTVVGIERPEIGAGGCELVVPFYK